MCFSTHFLSFVTFIVLKLLSKKLLSALSVGAMLPVAASTQLMDVISEYQASNGYGEVETEESSNQIQKPEDQIAAAEELIERWVLPNSSENERKVLEALQFRGIVDKNALATVMGNIKQESMFHSDICEGGARVSYGSCHSGGYGLIQWTTIGRYNGLGSHSYRNGFDPSTIDAQISYLFTEHQWRSVESFFKTPGHSIDFYMSKAYYWLGWGHHGARTHYSYDYASRLVKVQVPK